MTALVEWARKEANRLREVAGHFVVEEAPRVTTARAMQFFSDHANGSTFQMLANSALNQGDRALTAWRPIKAVARQLDEWADYHESGISRIKPFEVQFRIEAASDITEQARLLLRDRSVHPAAPIVLAGAALEEFLRSMLADSRIPEPGNPGISTYAEALRKAEILTRSEVKDVTAWADRRNDAAHGRFDELTREGAQIMLDGVNLFIRKHTSN